MAGRWIVPVDPDCPGVAGFYSRLLEDPLTEAICAPVDDIGEAFERKHRRDCRRCQEFGAANIDVDL